MLRIESVEIDDNILDKIESKHSISFSEIGRLVSQLGGTSEEGRKGYTKPLARRQLDAIS